MILTDEPEPEPLRKNMKKKQLPGHRVGIARGGTTTGRCRCGLASENTFWSGTTTKGGKNEKDTGFGTNPFHKKNNLKHFIKLFLGNNNSVSQAQASSTRERLSPGAEHFCLLASD